MAKKRTPQRKASASRAPADDKKQAHQLWFRVILTALLLAVYGFYLAHEINLTVGDLGRHLKNGQLVVESGSIPKTNLYSYAYPDYPFINHHWGSGVLFYLMERALGFSGLSLGFIALSVLTLWVFFNLATRYSSFALAAPITVIVLPVLITRHEVRPEVFSYLLSGVFLRVLWDYKSGQLSFRWLFLLPLLEILWVNLHIYFFIGIVLIGVYLLESLVVLFRRRQNQDARFQVKSLALILGLTILATVLNPDGISGAVYPFFILSEYGVPVIENFSVGAILRAGYTFLPLLYFAIVVGLLGWSWLYAMTKNRASVSLGNLLLSVIVFAMAWSAIRNFAYLAYFALALSAINLKGFPGTETQTTASRSILKITGSMALIALVLVLFNPAYFVSSNRGRIGIGLEAANGAAAEFFSKAAIAGPIFNNFDVAGYLVYHLYPKHRVFVDNRPEAYPEAFFNEVYFPLQLDETKWEQVSRRYGFNAIVFNHRERSLRGEQFIIRRVLDPSWAPIYFDKDILMLARRDSPNQSVIARYELPKERILVKSD